MKELEIRLNEDNTISFNDYIETRIAYEELCKELSKEKDKEIERLNNIINELEKFLDEEYKWCDTHFGSHLGYCMGQIRRIKDKLQELKGSDKE